MQNYFSHSETDAPFNTVEIPSHLKQSPSHNGRWKAGHLFYQVLLHLKQTHSKDLTNQLYQAQTWNCKPEIPIYRKYMYSIPAMLKESVVTTLRFSEERMYDHTEKYLMTITRKVREIGKQRTKKISNIRDTYICSKSTITHYNNAYEYS